MELKSDFVFEPLPPIDKPLEFALESLAASPSGLSRTWLGPGKDTALIPFGDPITRAGSFSGAEPDAGTLQVEEIKGAIPNRGLAQGDINMFGATYLHRSRSERRSRLHIEPASGDCAQDDKTRRGSDSRSMGSIPHGTTILAQGLRQLSQDHLRSAHRISCHSDRVSAQKNPVSGIDLSISIGLRSPPADIAGIPRRW